MRPQAVVLQEATCTANPYTWLVDVLQRASTLLMQEWADYLA